LLAGKVEGDIAATEMASIAERSKQIEARCRQEFESILSAVRESARSPSPVLEVEPALWRHLLALGRLG
jgi:hypothetical protein